MMGKFMNKVQIFSHISRDFHWHMFAFAAWNVFCEQLQMRKQFAWSECEVASNCFSKETKAEQTKIKQRNRCVSGEIEIKVEFKETDSKSKSLKIF